MQLYYKPPLLVLFKPNLNLTLRLRFGPTQPLASSKPPTIANGNHNLGYARQGCFATLPTITQVRLPFAIVGGLELARGFARKGPFPVIFP